ncbi:MAG: gamma-glutamyltransferase [Candidatus Latescibacterota bacterium]|nr:gamma-glutamyltransferase [Candidatus Latescibacterota bacterium]
MTHSKGLTHRPTVTGTRGMVSSAHPLASLAGLRILMDGGNAIDAAVATAAALNVVEPYMSGIGGAGFMHIYSARDKTQKVLDYMGLSAATASLDQFADEATRLRGPLPILVPGACGGWLEALARHGTMDPLTVFTPAIEMAEAGYAVTAKNHEFISSAADALRQHSGLVVSYLVDGRPPEPGQIITQTDLATTLRLVAEGGVEVFYTGELGQKISEHLESIGGLLTAEDLRGFELSWQDPISTDYRGFTICGPPPPCQSGQYLLQLNMLEAYDLADLGHNSEQALHLFLESGKLAVADRTTFTGIAAPPIEGMLSKEYAASRRDQIGDKTRSSGGETFAPHLESDQVHPGDPTAWMKTECTTHFDTVDAEGNAVSVTQSLGAGFGSAVVVPGTGIALNNLGRWFDFVEGSPNVIGPSKKIEMPMSPVQIWDKDGLRMLIGTPGSYGILQTTPQMIMNVLDHDMNIQAAIEAPRVKKSHGFAADVETRIQDEVLRGLERRGHELNRIGDWSAGVGGGQGIWIDPASGAFTGGADPRRDGYALGW